MFGNIWTCLRSVRCENCNSREGGRDILIFIWYRINLYPWISVPWNVLFRFSVLCS